MKLWWAMVAIVIALASLVFSHSLTRDLSAEERVKMEVWADAMSSLNKADRNTDLRLVLKVINSNHTIPVVVMDGKGYAQFFRNVEMHHGTFSDSLRQAEAFAVQMKKNGHHIRIVLDGEERNYVEVCYGESLMLKRLAYYPLVQLGVVTVFVLIAIIALLASKQAEQNRLWVGLSKETAHQLGTPISSLMAWTEILKEQYPDDALIPEMDEDVKRLQLIVDRFSKIGSISEPVPEHLNELIRNVADYMSRRTSEKVSLVTVLPDSDVVVRLNASLFAWVIENLCKNAVDAMGGGAGTIVLRVEDGSRKVAVEVEDTGKGIRRKNVAKVFRPGFTTKKRGWGLGLSLAKRIVEEYHHGSIRVKKTASGVGTVFRIELNKDIVQ